MVPAHCRIEVHTDVEDVILPETGLLENDLRIFIVSLHWTCFSIE